MHAISILSSEKCHCDENCEVTPTDKLAFYYLKQIRQQILLKFDVSNLAA